MGIQEKLMNIQNELKAPKGQFNSFGKYKYRSCEDILEAVKPLLKKNKCVMMLCDSIEMIGNRFYVKATAEIIDSESGENIINTAFAREEEEKKGQDGSQITGTASSYARKYALNGLFLIDDTKDADTDENRNEREGRGKKDEKPKESTPNHITEKEKKILSGLLKDKGYTEEEIFPNGIDSLTMDQYGIALQNLQKMGNKS